MSHHSFGGDYEFENWTQEGMRYLDELDIASFFSTRFAYRNIMMEMGIQDQVDDLWDRMHMGRLAHMDYLTYSELRKYFLATVDFIEDEENDNGHVYFIVGLNQYYVTFHEFYDIYRFPYSIFGSIREFLEASTIWRNIAMDGTFSISTAWMSKVRNPTIWYALRLVANTIFTRHQPGTSNIYELMML